MAPTKGISPRREHGLKDPALVKVMKERGVDSIPFYDQRGEETKKLRRRWRELKECRHEPVTAAQQPVTDPQAMSARIERLCLELGADAAGFAELRPIFVDAGKELPHKFVISFIVAEDYATTEKGPYAIEVEALSVYTVCSEIADKLARAIRDMGWPALAHHNGGGEIQAVPAMYWSGLGELGKHGSLIHPKYGASHRPGFVTTDLPLIETGPMIFGVQDRCMTCNLCTNNCPGEAIPTEFIETEGVKRWITDVEKCYPFSRLRSEYCHICVDVCPYVHVENKDPDLKSLYKSYMKGRKDVGYRSPAFFPEGALLPPVDDVETYANSKNEDLFPKEK